MLFLGLLGLAGLVGLEVGSQLSGFGEERMPSLIDTVSPDGESVASVAQSVVGTLTAGFSGLVLAILGGTYFAADPGTYRRRALLLLPREAHERIGEARHETRRALRIWLPVQMMSMALTFTAVFVGLTVPGVPSALALAIVGVLLGGSLTVATWLMVEQLWGEPLEKAVA